MIIILIMWWYWFGLKFFFCFFFQNLQTWGLTTRWRFDPWHQTHRRPSWDGPSASWECRIIWKRSYLTCLFHVTGEVKFGFTCWFLDSFDCWYYEINSDRRKLFEINLWRRPDMFPVASPSGTFRVHTLPVALRLSLIVILLIYFPSLCDYWDLVKCSFRHQTVERKRK